MPGAILWTRTTDAAEYRVLPDGCMDLLWMEGELVVAGPDTRAVLSRSEPGVRIAALRFAPGSGPGFLGVPAHEVRDARVPLADLWNLRRTRRLANRMGTTWAHGSALEEAAVELLEPVPDPIAGHVLRATRRGESVAAIAGQAGLGERQLHRRCLEAFGYGPKLLARVLRMNTALDQARAGRPLAQVAAATGYADQSHFTREVKTLAGVPPKVLLS